MNGVIGMVPDIPKAYTAIAEWLSCVVCICLYRREHHLPLRPEKREAAICLGALALLLLLQHALGVINVIFWIPGMLAATFVMYSMITGCCDMGRTAAGYWLAFSFMLAEVAAALEWQLYYFFAAEGGVFAGNTASVLFMLAVYGALFAGVYWFQSARSHQWAEITMREMLTSVLIAAITFALSNLSYIFSDTPFSTSLAKEAFHIRTMTDVGGFAIFLAYQRQCSEHHVQLELESVYTVLKTQYAQYKQSRENIDMINRKYHDLKHQIAVLRSEENQEKKNAYLDELEREIRDYEMQYKTGNSVLDTILTGKGMYCAQHKITLTCVADGRLLEGISVMDLCTIFGNALDNAIECELFIEPEEKRLIHLSVSEMNQFVLIRMENYLEESLRFANGLPVTTKGSRDEHGFGLKSIRYLAQKYGGSMMAAVEDNWFILKVMLPLGK